MARVMSPSILILPDMKACMGFSEPLSMPSQSSEDTVIVAPGLSWVPLLTSVGLGGRVGVFGGSLFKFFEELSCGFH